MNKNLRVIAALFVITLFSISCARLALRASPSLLDNFSSAIFEECDPELAKIAIPANLKLMEGLLRNDPGNRQILTLLSMGFSGYSMLFIEADDPVRGSLLYLRAKDYAIRALGRKGYVLKDMAMLRENLEGALSEMTGNDLKALSWTAMSWNAWINLNLDKPAALAQLRYSQACLEKVIEIDANYFHGLPFILMGSSLAVRPKMFGGNPEKAQDYFEKALRLTNRKFFLAHYYYAKYYTVRTQKKKMFFSLLREIIHGNPEELKDMCLINAVIQDKAKKLKEEADDLFLN